MALKLWLPLISDNKNQGISNYTPTGSPASWGNGPIGGCATFNNNASQNIVLLTSNFNFTTEDFSWCCFVNKKYSSMSAAAMWVFTVGRADAGGRGYGIKVSSSSSIEITFGNKSYSISTGFNDDEWHHVAFTKSNNIIKIYLDGILNTTATFNGTLPTYSDGNGLGIGCFHYTGNIYPLIGSVCDFRIYNNTLSDKEISEISKALMLHITFGNLNFGIHDCSGYNRIVETGNHAPTRTTGGPRNDAVGLFTNSAYIYPITDPIKSDTKEFSISLWFYTTSNTGVQTIWNGGDTRNDEVSIIISNNKLIFEESSQLSAVTISTNTWYHLVVTWKYGGNKTIYLNGELKITGAVGVLNKTNNYASIGCVSYADHVYTSDFFIGQLSDFRIYGKELTLNEIKALYNIPMSISNNGDLFTCSLNENYNYNGITFDKTGISKSKNIAELPIKYDSRVYIEPDGSCWLRIVHHADPTSYRFSSSDSFSTGVYKDSRRFFDGSICDMIDKWEFMVIQQLVSTDPEYKARWIQTKNPNTATFADVPASAITRILTTGYVSHGFGGLYYKNSSTYWCCNNGASNNWWGAVGAWETHQGGIPAMQMNGNSGIVKDTGFVDLYIRIDNVKWTNSRRTNCSFDKGSNGILATEFFEF